MIAQYKKHYIAYNILIGLTVFWYAAYQLPVDCFSEFAFQLLLMTGSLGLILTSALISIMKIADSELR